MTYSHWFVSRQKRQLTQILPALMAFNDICVGQTWAGNTELQFRFEDELQTRSITAHGNLRARRAGQGGGGIRTLFKQLKDLGLVFTETENKHCQLTLIGEALVKGDKSFVEAMRLQLQKYQYPSAACWTGSGSVDHRFHVHPFQFLFRLLLDSRLGHALTMDEMSGIVIHQADSDNDETFEKVVDLILRYRDEGTVSCFVSDTESKKYGNIANTFFNYISLTQYIDRGPGCILLRSGKEGEAAKFVQENPSFIPNPQIEENYQRAFGLDGKRTRDLRDFSSENNRLTAAQIKEQRIRSEYVLLSLETPITSITSDIVKAVSEKTGIDERYVETFLTRTYPNGNVSDFFASYREKAYMSREYATEFEIATAQVFEKIFKMRGIHLGQTGSIPAPDVFVEDKDYGYCGIIDNKAYKRGFSLTGQYKRVMIDEYIPHLNNYVDANFPLAFFSYLSGEFRGDIDSDIKEIYESTGVKGSAMPVNIFIDLAQDYAESGMTPDSIREIFSINREVRLSDLERLRAEAKEHYGGGSGVDCKVAENPEHF